MNEEENPFDKLAGMLMVEGDRRWPQWLEMREEWYAAATFVRTLQDLDTGESARRIGFGWNGVDGHLVVGTTCLAHDSETCDLDGDHWGFFVDPVNFDEQTGTMASGRGLNESEMREIAWLVEQVNGA